jgi:hypothetical protein
MSTEKQKELETLLSKSDIKIDYCRFTDSLNLFKVGWKTDSTGDFHQVSEEDIKFTEI